MSVLRIRRARRDDAPAISVLGLALNEDEDVPARRFTPDAVTRDAFVPDPRVLMYVAARDRRIIGYALATPSYGEQSDGEVAFYGAGRRARFHSFLR